MTQRNPDSAPYLQLLMEAGSQKFSDRMVKLNSPVFVGRQTFEQTKQLNRHKVDAKHINFKKKKADGDEDNNEVEAVAE